MQRFLVLTLASLAVIVPPGVFGGPQPLSDPVPVKILKGDIVVMAVPFVRAPRTYDPHDRPTMLEGIPVPLASSGAYARLQYMQPVGDGSGRLAISDIRGVLYLVDADGQNLTSYLDLRDSAPDFDGSIFPNEAGLLGFAFHPEFGMRGAPGYGRFYTGYSSGRDSGVADYLDMSEFGHEDVLREWIAEDPSASVFSGTSRPLLRVGQFAPNHNIGTLAFNVAARPGEPDHGKLYICIGDGGGAFDPYDHGQSLDNPLGAILRIDPLAQSPGRAYGIPADNPFVSTKGAAPEIWAYGLRHPQHFSFDRGGRMFINDIGQNQVEEVNIGVSGGNYGWRLREGTFLTGYGAGLGLTADVYPLGNARGDFIYPVAQYDHDEGNAVSSGHVYHGDGIPQLRGQYVAADIVTGRMFYFDAGSVRPGEPALLQELRVVIDGEEQPLIEAVGYANTYAPGTRRVDLRLGIDNDGELYLLTKGDGWIRKLVSVGSESGSESNESGP
ncbi:MAG: PQQ-dependent sugar dehydrogenase [Proteobacteria bacterium]|nr:PQQ-dependent sugar dehydrogenase [Pseudomonadota bacterium]